MSTLYDSLDIVCRGSSLALGEVDEEDVLPLIRQRALPVAGEDRPAAVRADIANRLRPEVLRAVALVMAEAVDLPAAIRRHRDHFVVPRTPLGDRLPLDIPPVGEAEERLTVLAGVVAPAGMIRDVGLLRIERRDDQIARLTRLHQPADLPLQPVVPGLGAPGLIHPHPVAAAVVPASQPGDRREHIGLAVPD